MFSILLSLALAGEATEAPTADDSQKVVCKTEWEVGSRIPNRICRTRAEWDNIEQANEDQLRNRWKDSRGTQNSN